ncbi:hypothetical protein EBI_27650 [Enterocytozoon bieneusi H348]|nr:hypothetical protein EBI_27650 [Enterocytozoon bieneusi H348]|eukprot:XP_002650784.1 hypothetical protein EBI_27650 [Enterocytozoon bieneusi H348]
MGGVLVRKKPVGVFFLPPPFFTGKLKIFSVFFFFPRPGDFFFPKIFSIWGSPKFSAGKKEFFSLKGEKN